MKNDLASILKKGLGEYFSPLISSAESADNMLEFFQVIGWEVDSIFEDDLNLLYSEIKNIDEAITNLDSLVEMPSSNFTELRSALGRVLPGIESIRGLSSLKVAVDPIILDDFPNNILNALTIFYLHDKYPFVFNLFRLLSVIQTRDQEFFIEGEILLKSRQEIPYIFFDRLGSVSQDPAKEIGAKYWPDGIPDMETADIVAERFFARIASVLGAMNLVCSVQYVEGPVISLKEYEEAKHFLLIFEKELFSYERGEYVSFGATIGLIPENEAGPGFYIIPFGELSVSELLDNWQLELDVSGAAGGLQITSTGLKFIGESTKSELDSQITLSRMSIESPALLIGSSSGTRLEIQDITLAGKAKVDANSQEYSVFSIFDKAELVIKPDDGDGFIRKLIPAEGLSIDFDLAIGWSNLKGIHIKGNTGLETTLPIQLSLFGILSIDSIYLAIKTDQEEGIQSIVAASIRTKIGPIEAILDKVGLEANINAPDRGGNLGLIDLDFSFKSPSSIGLSINAEGITGGGFLKIDPPNYAGMMQLSFKNEIELTAFGLITTKLPDGKDGFSLVIQIMAEFQPIQLGLGFALTGVGGLIGINRQINEEALTEAFKNHSLDTFLFPENPIKDAVKIIDSIQTIMPPREGYHVIGPMVQMFWGGSVRLVEFEVGIFIQTGGPLKVVIIGQARTQLPEGKSPRLVINMDVLGIIDYGEERIAIDAVLFNSRILNYALDGKMALRSDWSSGEESFALSVGGFHPEFRNIPTGFPQLTRLMVTIGSGNPRLTLQMYLAITPNTLQIGAKFELWAKKSGFTITGGTSFDALFTFSPLSFLVMVKIWANIKRGRFGLGVDLELELSGPNPMIAIGYAKFKIGWFSKKVRFRKQFGDKTPEPLLVVSPLAAILTALEHQRSTRFELPAWASASLVFTQTAESKIDPVADIFISQSVVPLNFNMQRFGGGNPPLSEQRLSITAGFEPEKEKITKTLFAPEQFKNWSTEERLAAKAFENYDAGIRFSSDYIIPEGAIERRDIGFETVLRESRSYRHKLTKNDVKREGIRTTCVKQTTIAEAQYFVNWSLFGSNNYFKPLRKVRDKNHVYSIKVLEPGYVLTDTYQQEDSSSTPVLESQKQHTMSYAEALDAFKDDNNPQSVIRSATDAILQ